MSRKVNKLTPLAVLALAAGLPACPAKQEPPQAPAASTLTQTFPEGEKPGTRDPSPAPAAPRFRVAKAQVENPEATAGEILVVKATLANEGGEGGAPAALRIIAGEKVLAERKNLIPLAAGASRTETFYVKVDDPGAFAVRAVLDPGPAAGPSDPAAAASEEIRVTVHSSRRPELQISLEGPAEPPAPGAEYFVLARARNAGEAEAKGVTIHLLRGGAPAGTETIGLLRPGEEKAVPFRVRMGAGGADVLSARVDPLENVEESNEGNNDAAPVTVAARPTAPPAPPTPPVPPTPLVAPTPPPPPPPPGRPAAPDLRLANLIVSPNRPAAGGRASVEADVRNTGDEEARSVEVEVLVAGVPAGTQSVRLLQPGRSTAVSFPIAFRQPGEVGVAVRVDPRNRIAEQNETDNAQEAVVQVGAPPLADLALASFEPERDRLPAGESAFFRGRVTNLGNAPAAETRLVVRRAGNPVGEVRVPALEPGRSFDFRHEVRAPGEGAHDFQAGFGNLAFQDPTPDNNTGAARCHWAPPPPPPPVPAFPDLRVPDLDVRPDRTRVGEGIVVVAVIVNEGRGPSPQAEAELHIGDEPPVRFGVPPLPPGGRTTVEIPASPGRPGDVIAEVHLDPENRVREENDRNNDSPPARLRVDPPPPAFPDLASPDVDLRPNRVRAGETLTVFATIVNEGRGPSPAAEGELHVGDEARIRFAIPPLPPQGRTIAEIPSAPGRPGDWLVEVHLDPGNRVREEDEGNNDSPRVRLRVDPAPPPPAAAVAVRGHRVEPQRPAEGAPFRIVFTLENTGNGAAAAAPFELVVGGAVLVRVTAPAIPPRRSVEFPVELHGLEAGRQEFSARFGPEGTPHAHLEGAFDVAARAPAAPVFRVAGHRFEPASPMEGAGFQAIFTLENTGHGAAEALVFLLRLDGKDAARSMTPRLHPRSRSDFVVAVPGLPAGRHGFEAHFGEGPGHLHIEGEIAVAGKPAPPPAALSIAEYDLKPERPDEGKPFLVSVKIENRGHGAADPVPYEIVVGGAKAEGMTPAVPPHRDQRFRAELPGLPAGTHEIVISVGEGAGHLHTKGRVKVSARPAPFADKQEAEAGDVKVSSPKPEVIRVEDDPAASGGKTRAMPAASWLEFSVSIPITGEYSVTVRARGTPAKGENPRFVLAADGRPFHRAEAGEAYADLGPVDVTLSKGKRTIRLTYENDDIQEGVADRNLYVDFVEVGGK